MCAGAVKRAEEYCEPTQFGTKMVLSGLLSPLKGQNDWIILKRIVANEESDLLLKSSVSRSVHQLHTIT